LRQGIECLYSGWDDYVSCADPDAAPDRCDRDDQISRDLRHASGNPLFRTRAEAHAWCISKASGLSLYGITSADLQAFDSGIKSGPSLGLPVAYLCPDRKPHAIAMIAGSGPSFICSTCGKWMRLPEHTFFRVSLWGAADIARQDALH
jgi:hypothetical protein